MLRQPGEVVMLTAMADCQLGGIVFYKGEAITVTLAVQFEDDILSMPTVQARSGRRYWSGWLTADDVKTIAAEVWFERRGERHRAY